jgi:S-DNA-T family DNA segregation ATPase FtsK/SpoIIIE
MNLSLGLKKSVLKKIVIGLAIGIFSCLVAMVLFSFHPEDPSWFFASSKTMPVHNVFGFVGANMAALLFFLFGSAALLLIPALFFLAYVIAFDEFTNEWDRLLVLFSGVLLCAVLGALYHVTIFPHGFIPGGTLGTVLYEKLIIFSDYSLVVIFLHVLLLICMIIISRLSLLTITNAAKKTLLFLADKDRCIKPLMHIILKAFSLAKSPFVFAYQRSRELLNSYLVEKKHPDSALDFEVIVMKEMNEILEDSFWKTYQKDLINTIECNEQQTDQVQASYISEKNLIAKPESLESNEKNYQVVERKIPYQLPPLNIFKKDKQRFMDAQARQEHEAMAKRLEEKLSRFGIQGTVVSIKAGPVVTLFEYQPHIDSKLSKIVALEDDLALALQATSIRIIAPIPGTAVVGFEVANKVRADVLFSTIVHSKEFTNFSGRLPLVLGVDTTGNTMIVDLTAMPHVLIAGSTGSGKSVAMNVILMSLLCQCKPEQLRLILIDPKRLEFAPYADIPHLLFPIVTHPKDASPVLQWVVSTMEERYELMAECGVRNIFDYNKLTQAEPEREKLPFIVVMIDELADLMMVAGKEIEEKIARIAQMARAAGIHLIVATQRPSVDVITGIIKANFPSRISFKIATKIDSRTILDTVGADKLLGKGDMLYLDSASRLIRAHGAYVSDKEIEEVAEHVRAMQPVEYLDLTEVVQKATSEVQEGDEQLFQEVLEYLKTIDEVSISALQRRFRIGYNRSARIMEMLEAHGVILPSTGSKMRKVIHS